MKNKIEISAVNKIVFEKSNFLFLDFFTENNFDRKIEEWEKLGLNFNGNSRNEIKKNDVKKIEFNYNGNITSKILLIKYDLKISTDFFRDQIAAVFSEIASTIKTVFINIPCDDKDLYEKFGSENYYKQTFIEGIFLGNYTFDKYKSDKPKQNKIKVKVLFRNGNPKKIISKAEKITNAVTFSRNLVNEPANILTPQEFAKRIKKEFQNTSVNVRIYNSKQIEKMNMNALLSVGKASDNPPILIKLTYNPPKSKIKFAFVGKGVMYDSGGLSLKPTSGMIDMKGDMAGASTVVGIMKAVENLNLNIKLTAVIPVVENVISGNAYKPGDIIHTASGKTIEVGNTDAEGRLILADALEFAEKEKPDFIFDFATLTGACIVALGESYAGFFTENKMISELLLKSSELTYENIWQLPLPEKYNELLKSELADISNVGSTRWGGAITAALFLKFFLSDKMKTNWVHFDIAGPAFKHNQSSYTKKYATGFGVRLLIDFLEKYSE